MRSITFGSRSSSPLFLLTNIAIGTPQARWREITQSGRCAIMECSRVLPCGGTKRVSSIAFSATSRRPLVAIEMNHCGVLRKMSGAFDRQECG